MVLGKQDEGTCRRDGSLGTEEPWPSERWRLSARFVAASAAFLGRCGRRRKFRGYCLPLKSCPLVKVFLLNRNLSLLEPERFLEARLELTEEGGPAHSVLWGPEHPVDGKKAPL